MFNTIDGCTVITGGRDTKFARMLALRSMLSLEIKGLTRRGRSAYSIIKEEFGFKGNKEKVLEQLEAYIEQEKQLRIKEANGK